MCGTKNKNTPSTFKKNTGVVVVGDASGAAPVSKSELQFADYILHAATFYTPPPHQCYYDLKAAFELLYCVDAGNYVLLFIIMAECILFSPYLHVV